MKIVLKLDNCISYSGQSLRKFATAVAQLLTDGHRIIIVNDTDGAAMDRTRIQVEESKEETDASIENAERLSRMSHNEDLVAALGQVGIAAFGLYATDSNIIRIRKKQIAKRNGRDFAVEAAHVDPRWLEIISQNGGVPVIVNIGFGPNQQYWYVDGDQMAGKCAAGWSADTLIFLTHVEGLRTTDGSVVRWLYAEEIMDLARMSIVDHKVLPKLNACHEALRRGVRRARLFPFSQIESLSLFYFARIDFGTEVILAAQLQRAC